MRDRSESTPNKLRTIAAPLYISPDPFVEFEKFARYFPLPVVCRNDRASMENFFSLARGLITTDE